MQKILAKKQKRHLTNFTESFTLITYKLASAALRGAGDAYGKRRERTMKYPIHSLRTIGCAASIAALAAIPARAVNVVGDANAETTVSPSNTVIKMTQSGTLTVTEPGEIEILLVGGGGGGGSGSNPYWGGGGGAGGVIHKTTFQVAAGEWDVIIGAGGTVGANGGKTMAFGMTAWGGGHGATGGGANAASGASGGGGAGRQWWNDGLANSKGADVESAYTNAPYCNLGNAGSDAPYATECSGAGGGAGGPAGAATPNSNGTHRSRPGAAYVCSITGSDVAYAGGGSGRAWNDFYRIAGGGSGSYGGGGDSGGAGGPGVVIVRFTRNVKTEMAFDDATGGTVTKCWVDGVKYQVHTFSQSGQFSIPHHGHVEVLVVGGGGGGGSGSNPYWGGGGGAGGVIHKTTFQVAAGEWDVIIGAGGTVGANGGKTMAFGMTAWGGGHGATGGGANAASGASGGGGAGRQWWNDGLANSKGADVESAYTNAPYCNLGNAGSDAPYATECSGAGGGAGGPAGAATPNSNGTHRSRPGAAYVCSITGSDVAYAGGGSGRAWNDFYRIAGGGSGSYGGGGDSGGAGGPGVVIVRHQLPKTDATVISFR